MAVAKAAKATETKSTPTKGTYTEQAAVLATDVRAWAEDMRDKSAEFDQRCTDLNQTEPGPDGASAADGVRRIPMATDDLNRALASLQSVASDLAVKAQP